MTSQIADCIIETIIPHGVAAVTSGQHLCSIMRGVKKNQTRVASSCLRGAFEKDENLQARLFSQIRLS